MTIQTKDYARWLSDQAAPAAPAPVEVPAFLRADGPPAARTGSASTPILPTTDAARKALPIFTYITEYFPDALIEETRVSVLGNAQHNPGQPLHWAREKSKDQLNTAFRHMLDHKSGTIKDTDGAYHLAKAIWRLKAELQLTIERERSSGH